MNNSKLANIFDMDIFEALKPLPFLRVPKPHLNKRPLGVNKGSMTSDFSGNPRSTLRV